MSTVRGFKRIVLATDGSDQAEAALDATIALGRDSSAEVEVVHVWNGEDHGEAGRRMAGTLYRLRAAGLFAESKLSQARGDDVASTICQAARDFDADLIVMGSRGLSDWESIYKHSVSHQVLSATDCPLLVVRTRPSGGVSGPRRVLLAIAGGNDMGSGVSAAVAAAKAEGSRVLVVHVAQAIFGVHGEAYIESEEDIQATMASAIALVEEAGVKAEGMVAHAGPVANTVAEIAAGWNADLIVVGSSRMGDVGSLLIGSVSHNLLHGTDRPVLIAERVKS
jgi:nucleotide-binding universal stress UspA family protein